MRIINRVIKTKETENGIETHITERIVEIEQGRVIVSGSSESNLSGIQVRCNICTRTFDFDNTGKCCCPSCGSRDVSLI